MANQEIKKGRWATKRANKKKKQSQKVDSYRKTGRLRLQEMLKAGLGTKRSTDKIDDDTKDKIYSKSTFKTYRSQFKKFCEWLEKHHPEVKTSDEAISFLDEYLQWMIDLNTPAPTISTAKSALVKVFQVESTDFIKTPPRERANVTRSRDEVKRDKHISSKTEEKFARMTSALGLRRAEMKRIKAEDLFFKDGKAMLKVDKGTKGGKSREVEIVGKTDAETKDIVRWIQSKKGRLFPKLPSHYDNHFYRAAYANRMYKKYARDVSKINNKKEKYIMRKDRAGEVYDRVAMLIVSKNLGHGRVSVIAQSYLYQVA